MSGWDTYVHQICNKFDPETNAWAVTNCCQFAAVYGHDGTAWATSQGFQLASYEMDQDQGDGTTKKITVNEVGTLLAACNK